MAEWEAEATRFRESLQLNFRDPRDFSRYLVTVYGPKADPAWQQLFVNKASAISLADYPAALAAWQRAMAPEGLQAARGLHSVGFLPGDDILSMVIRERSAQDEGEGTSNYTMNAPIASWLFATQALHREHQSVNALLARAMVAKDRTIEESDLINRTLHKEEDFPRSSKAEASPRNRPAKFARREFSDAERRKLLKLSKQVSQPMVMVTSVDKNSFKAFGGDSESGETLEAEIKVRHCEPECLLHVFIASMTPVGDPVDDDMIRLHALSEHWELEGRYLDYDMDVTLYLHPETELGAHRKKAKLVKHLPAGFRWYSLDVG